MLKEFWKGLSTELLEEIVLKKNFNDYAREISKRFDEGLLKGITERIFNEIP